MNLPSFAHWIGHAVRHPYALLPGTPSGIINSTRDWVADRQRNEPLDIRRGAPAICWEIGKPALRSLPPPRTIGDPDAVQPVRLFPTMRTALFLLRGARILGGEGAVISPDNKVFAEFTYADEPGGIHGNSVFRRRRVRPVRPLRGCYATLCYPSATAYAHWIVESLPRLALLEPHIGALDGIFVPAGLTESMRESLLAFGVRDDQIIALDITSHVAPEQLLVPAYCAGLNIPSWVPQFMRSRVCGPDAERRPERRIYVSRAKVHRRRVVNEETLHDILKQWSFEIVHPQELTFTEQAKLFNEAHIVLGPSGAAMFNALFCRPGGVLIEMPPHHSIGCHYYYSIAATVGMAYWWVPGAAAVNPPANGDLEHVDFHADAEALAKTLECVLGHHRQGE
jgi:hypothetical protein